MCGAHLCICRTYHVGNPSLTTWYFKTTMAAANCSTDTLVLSQLSLPCCQRCVIPGREHFLRSPIWFQWGWWDHSREWKELKWLHYNQHRPGSHLRGEISFWLAPPLSVEDGICKLFASCKNHTLTCLECVNLIPCECRGTLGNAITLNSGLISPAITSSWLTGEWAERFPEVFSSLSFTQSNTGKNNMRDTGEEGGGGNGDKISKSEKDQVGKHIVKSFFSVSHLLVVFWQA